MLLIITGVIGGLIAFGIIGLFIGPAIRRDFHAPPRLGFKRGKPAPVIPQKL